MPFLCEEVLLAVTLMFTDPLVLLNVKEE
jgi:hypothetical protein